MPKTTVKKESAAPWALGRARTGLTSSLAVGMVLVGCESRSPRPPAADPTSEGEARVCMMNGDTVHHTYKLYNGLPDADGKMSGDAQDTNSAWPGEMACLSVLVELGDSVTVADDTLHLFSYTSQPPPPKHSAFINVLLKLAKLLSDSMLLMTVAPLMDGAEWLDTLADDLGEVGLDKEQTEELVSHPYFFAGTHPKESQTEPEVFFPYTASTNVSPKDKIYGYVADPFVTVHLPESHDTSVITSTNVSYGASSSGVINGVFTWTGKSQMEGFTRPSGYTSTGYQVFMGTDAIYMCHSPRKDWSLCSKPMLTVPLSLVNQPPAPQGSINEFNNTEAEAELIFTVRTGASFGSKPQTVKVGTLGPGDNKLLYPAAFGDDATGYALYFKTNDMVGQCMGATDYDPASQKAQSILLNYAFGSTTDTETRPVSAVGPYRCLTGEAALSAGYHVPVPKKIEAAKCPATDPGTPPIFGYWTNYSTYNGYQPYDVSCDVDVLVYAFAQVGDCDPSQLGGNTGTECASKKNSYGSTVFTGTQDYQLHSSDPWADFTRGGGLGNIAVALATGKDVRLSVGGWGLSGPMGQAISATNREGFAESIVTFIKNAQAEAKAFGVENQFSGVDIDWEPNGNNWTLDKNGSSANNLTVADLDNYLAFLKLLKAQLTAAADAGAMADSQLTIAITGNPAALGDVDEKYKAAHSGSEGYWAELSAVVDSLDLMTYDYFSPGFSSVPFTNFNSPLFADAAQPAAFDAQFNTEDSVEALKAANVPSAKIVIGSPGYGRLYKLTQAGATDDAYQAYDGEVAGPLPSTTGRASSDTMPYFIAKTGRNHLGAAEPDYAFGDFQYVPDAGASFAVGTAKGEPSFISSETPTSAQERMHYAAEKALGGVMFYSLPDDYKRNAKLADSIISGLAKGRSGPPPEGGGDTGGTGGTGGSAGAGGAGGAGGDAGTGGAAGSAGAGGSGGITITGTPNLSRCGIDFNHAENACTEACTKDADCGTGESCFDVTPATGENTVCEGTSRCGDTYADALKSCYPCYLSSWCADHGWGSTCFGQIPTSDTAVCTTR